MSPFDPLSRWRQLGLDEKPDYAGMPTFSGMPWSENPEDLGAADVAIIGAPTDDLVSDRPGTRFGPRGIRAASCPPGPHLEEKIDWSEVLRVIDYGDAPMIPGDPQHNRQALRQIVGEVAGKQTFPIILGGDHSIARANIEALAEQHGPISLVQFDTHTDTGQDVFGNPDSHGTMFYQLVEEGLICSERYVQVGLRGYWPGQQEFDWQQQHGITSLFMHQVRDHGIKTVISQVLEIIEQTPCFLSVDIDVLDPAFAPGTGTPEPGGMSTTELLWAVRNIAKRANLVGMDMVEVIPTGVASSDITCLAAERIIREALSGLARRKWDQQRKA